VRLRRAGVGLRLGGEWVRRAGGGCAAIRVNSLLFNILQTTNFSN